MSFLISVWNFLEKISLPRFVGSQGHEEARIEIVSNMKKHSGIIFEEQSFPAYLKSFPRVKLLQIIMGILICFLPLLYAINAYRSTLVITIILMIFAISLSNLTQAEDKRDMRQPDVIQGRNLIFRLNPKNSTKKTVVILAHYDSITRPFPIIMTGILFIVAYAGGFLYLIQNLIYSIAALFFDYFLGPWQSLLWGITIGLSLFLFAFDRPSNHTPGTVDNASGVATLFYLAQVMQNHPLEHTRILLVATDAEELGNLGGKAFIANNQAQLERDSTYFIVVDSVGCKQTNRVVIGSRFPKRNYSATLETYAREIITQEIPNYPLELFRFPPFLAVQSDHNPVLDAKYDFLLMGGVSTDYHSPRDNINAIDQAKFFKNCVFLEKMVYRIDSDAQKNSS